MASKTYWKDIRQSFSSSKGRVLSIISLMALGSFALIGLKVTPPNMQSTGEHFFRQHQVADLYVFSNYGLDKTDQELLDSLENQAIVEYGYFKDVVLKDSTDAIRIFSTPDQLSTYDLVEGTLPSESNQIALTAALQNRYQIGDTITIDEKEDSTSNSLKHKNLTISGFVNSSELLSRVNMGQSTAGSGELRGYAVIPPQAFNSDVYMLARIAYSDLSSLSPYDDAYLNQVHDYKDEIQKLVADQPHQRLAELKKDGQAKIDQGQTQIQAAKAQLKATEKQLRDADTELGQKEEELALAQSQRDLLSPEQLLALDAKSQELDAAKKELASKQTAFEKEKPKAESDIKTKEEELAQAQDKLDNLANPTYAVYTRREIPGSEGYVSYENNASIINSVGNIFPLVLYFIAAMVTFTTMARFVDEERLKMGTLRALGYDKKEIIRKFVMYGAVTGILGTTIGTILGHTLLPSIIYSTYSQKIILAPMELHFYPGKTLLALLLGLLSTVLPAYLVARKALTEQPAQLLLPKPPVAGEKILLEKIQPLWSRLSFTQKVTARNIFRYKQRMFMTIFGVCGSIALLFAGLGVRSSIADLNNRQFTDLIKYDMIVATQEKNSTQEETAFDKLLKDKAIKSSMPVHYEKVTKVAGEKQDQQTITLLATDNQNKKEFENYIHLVNRQSQESLELPSEGTLVSEKLAQILDLQVGDSFTVETGDQQSITIQVSGIIEMYMGHFIFMNTDAYDQAFKTPALENASLIRLQNTSKEETNRMANEFMKLDNVQGVVQNTSLKEQVTTIVQSLNRVMIVLIATSVLLAIVILYNLTNINVAERIRELSTIKVLGFYDKEVTLYIYRESIYLSIFGILLGFLMGSWLHAYMIQMIPPEFILFNPHLEAIIYIIPALVIITILILLGLIVNQWLKKVDMLEALKSVE